MAKNKVPAHDVLSYVVRAELRERYEDQQARRRLLGPGAVDEVATALLVGFSRGVAYAQHDPTHAQAFLLELPDDVVVALKRHAIDLAIVLGVAYD